MTGKERRRFCVWAAMTDRTEQLESALRATYPLIAEAQAEMTRCGLNEPAPSAQEESG